MKNTIIFAVVAVVAVTIASCSKSDRLAVLETDETKVSNPAVRSYTEALKIAQSAAMFLEGSDATRSNDHNRLVDETSVRYIIKNGSTRTDGVSDTLMYIFNYENEEGFAVVSSSKNTVGLLAVAESGSYDDSTEVKNEPFGLFMALASDYVQVEDQDASSDSLPLCSMVINPDLDPRYGIIDVEEYVTTAEYGPYVAARWHQGAPHSRFCKDSLNRSVHVGCGPIAIGQVLSYYEYPSTIHLTYDGNYPASTVSLDWDSINASIVHLDPFDVIHCAGSSNIHNQMGYLLRQIGEYCEIDYWSHKSATSFWSMYHALDSLNLHRTPRYTYSSFESTMHDALQNGHPSIMTGLRNDTIGHAWVVDGYKSVDVYWAEYRCQENTLIMELIDRTYMGTNYYNHINWGWAGDCNGYFLSGVFNTRGYESLDSGCSSIQNNTYSMSLSALIDIYPN